MRVFLVTVLLMVAVPAPTIAQADADGDEVPAESPIRAGDGAPAAGPAGGEPGFLRLVGPATLGAAAGSLAGFAAGAADGQLGYALLTGMAGGALGAGLGMKLVGEESPWGPALAAVLAGVAGIVVVNATLDLDSEGVFVGFVLGEGIASALLAAATR